MRFHFLIILQDSLAQMQGLIKFLVVQMSELQCQALTNSDDAYCGMQKAQQLHH